LLHDILDRSGFVMLRQIVKSASVLFACGAVLAGCTAQPLYSDKPIAAATEASQIDGAAASSMSMQSTLSTVAVSQANSKQGIIVRNRLIFLLGQGRGEPRSPAYTLQVNVSGSAQGIFATPGAGVDADQPTARVYQLTGTYTLAAEDGAVIVKGSRVANAAFDVPSQAFSERAALADAEERAGTELAEMIHLAVAQALASK
jgi:LPS-assembly lipoprotein